MAQRKTSSEHAGPAALPMAPLADLPRQQLSAIANGTCALLRGFESLRRMQLGAAHHTVARHEAAAGRLQEPCSSVDLLAWQADLLRQDTQAAAAYWQQMGAIALQLQRDLLGSMAQGAETEAGDAATVLQSFAESMPNPGEFFFRQNGGQRGKQA